ncbi:MAG: hypothetical protein VW338_10785 [Rhodospirillaceae bacterium]
MTDKDAPSDPTPPPDLEDLAKQYLDMWQAQVNAMAGDGEATKALAGTMAMMGAGAQSFAQAFAEAARQAATAARTGAADDGGGGTGAGANPGAGGAAAAADAAPGDASAAVNELARRLAAAEERIARLESQVGNIGNKISGRDRQDDP